MNYRFIINILPIVFSATIMHGCKTASSGKTENVSYKRYQGKKVKHGPYKLNDKFGRVLGLFKNGKHAGVWRYFDENGRYVHGYDFHSEKFLKYQPVKYRLSKFYFYHNKKWKVPENDDFTPPKFKLGNPGFMRTYSNEIYYPQIDEEKVNGGQVIIECKVNQYGKLMNEKVKQGVSDPLNEIALSVIKSIPDLWKPARYQGKKVMSKIYFPLTFKYEGLDQKIKSSLLMEKEASENI